MIERLISHIRGPLETALDNPDLKAALSTASTGSQPTVKVYIENSQELRPPYILVSEVSEQPLFSISTENQDNIFTESVLVTCAVQAGQIGGALSARERAESLRQTVEAVFYQELNGDIPNSVLVREGIGVAAGKSKEQIQSFEFVPIPPSGVNGPGQQPQQPLNTTCAYAKIRCMVNRQRSH